MGIQFTEIYDVFWEFANERQNVFWKRIEGEEPPWTINPILNKHRFTNPYRVFDRVSKYLLKNLVPHSLNDKDLIFRILFFKIFNKIDTWNEVEDKTNGIHWKKYRFDEYDAILNSIKKPYSGAYIMQPAMGYGHKEKHRNHLNLIEDMMNDQIPMGGIDYIIYMSDTMEHLFLSLKDYHSIGPFMAYQLATDINYTSLTDFSECEFTAIGPGSKRGIEKCVKDLPRDWEHEDVIKYVTEYQNIEFEMRDIDFKNLYGRDLQYIDVQNLFCELDKYTRISHPNAGLAKRMKRNYSPVSDHLPLEPLVLPEKWGIAI